MRRRSRNCDAMQIFQRVLLGGISFKQYSTPEVSKSIIFSLYYYKFKIFIYVV
jgi:hypothetical protein